MGSSISCLCTQLSTLDDVLIMKEDGKLLGFKDGTTVKAVLAENPHHKSVHFGPERTVPADSFQLRCDQFYLLLPEGLDLNDERFGRLLQLLLGKDRNNGGKSEAAEREKVVISSGNNFNSLGESKSWNYRWKPELEAIPEVNSPAEVH